MIGRKSELQDRFRSLLQDINLPYDSGENASQESLPSSSAIKQEIESGECLSNRSIEESQVYPVRRSSRNNRKHQRSHPVATISEHDGSHHTCDKEECSTTGKGKTSGNDYYYHNDKLRFGNACRSFELPPSKYFVVGGRNDSNCNFDKKMSDFNMNSYHHQQGSNFDEISVSNFSTCSPTLELTAAGTTSCVEITNNLEIVDESTCILETPICSQQDQKREMQCRKSEEKIFGEKDNTSLIKKADFAALQGTLPSFVESIVHERNLVKTCVDAQQLTHKAGVHCNSSHLHGVCEFDQTVCFAVSCDDFSSTASATAIDGSTLLTSTQLSLPNTQSNSLFSNANASQQNLGDSLSRSSSRSHLICNSQKINENTTSYLPSTNPPDSRSEVVTRATVKETGESVSEQSSQKQTETNRCHTRQSHEFLKGLHEKQTTHQESTQNSNSAEKGCDIPLLLHLEIPIVFNRLFRAAHFLIIIIQGVIISQSLIYSCDLLLSFRFIYTQAYIYIIYMLYCRNYLDR